MRKIKVFEWKAKDESGKDITEDTLLLLNLLISNKKPEEMPKGLDKFRIFSKLLNAFEKAQETKVLELEEREYNFLKNIIEKDIPSIWGGNKNISKAIEEFMEAKEY